MRIRNPLLAVLALSLTTGCTSFWAYDQGHGSRNGVSSSLVDYLYPNGEVPPEVISTVPHLELPLRVGIAFVPSADRRNVISEATKIGLLEEVKKGFADRQYIQHIEVIPDTYLRSSNGIEGMQQVARLYGVDVMALVSYDQVASLEDNKASLLYWTIVGAYIIQGTDSETQTFVDTAVFDVNTARLLFRAPGINKSVDRTTMLEAGEVLRKNREASFTSAMNDMSVNLDAELDRFRERVKNDTDVATVAWKPSFGGGSVGTGFLLLLSLQVFQSVQRRQRVARG